MTAKVIYVLYQLWSPHEDSRGLVGIEFYDGTAETRSIWYSSSLEHPYPVFDDYHEALEKLNELNETDEHKTSIGWRMVALTVTLGA